MTRPSTAKRRMGYFAGGGQKGGAIQAGQTSLANVGPQRKSAAAGLLAAMMRRARQALASIGSTSGTGKRVTTPEGPITVDTRNLKDPNSLRNIESSAKKSALEVAVETLQGVTWNKILADRNAVQSATAPFKSTSLAEITTAATSAIDAQMNKLREQAQQLVVQQNLSVQQQRLLQQNQMLSQALAKQKQGIQIAQMTFNYQQLSASYATIVPIINQLIFSLNEGKSTLNGITVPSNPSAAMSAESTTANTQITTIINALYALQADPTKLATQQATLTAEITTQLAQIGAYESEANMRITDITAKRTTYNSYSTQLNVLNGDLKTMKDSLGSIQQQLVFEPSGDYNALIQQRDALNSEIGALQEDIATLEGLMQQNVLDTDAAFDLLQKANDDKEAAVQSFYSGFTGELAAAREGLITANGKYAESRAAVENVGNFLTGLTNPANMNALVAGRDGIVVPDATPSAPVLGSQMILQTGIVEKIQEDLNDVYADLQRMQNDLATAKATRDTTQARLQGLRRDAVVLKNAIQTLNELDTGVNVSETAMDVALSLVNQLSGSVVIPSTSNMVAKSGLLDTAVGLLNGINTDIATKTTAVVNATATMGVYESQIAEKTKVLLNLQSLSDRVNISYAQSAATAAATSTPTKPNTTAAKDVAKALAVKTLTLVDVNTALRGVVSSISALSSTRIGIQANQKLAMAQTYFQRLVGTVSAGRPTLDGTAALQAAGIRAQETTLGTIVTVTLPTDLGKISPANGLMATANQSLIAASQAVGARLASSNTSFRVIDIVGPLKTTLVPRITTPSQTDPGAVLSVSSPAKPSYSNIMVRKQEITDKTLVLIRENQELAYVKAVLLQEQKELMSEQGSFTLANLQDALKEKIGAIVRSRSSNAVTTRAAIETIIGVQTTLNEIKTTEVTPATEGVSTSESAKDAAIMALQGGIDQFIKLIAANNKSFSNILSSQELKAASIAAVPPSTTPDPGLALDAQSPATPSTAAAIAMNSQTTQKTISLSDASQGLAEVKARLIEKQILLRGQQANFDLTSLQDLLVATIDAIEASRPTKDGSSDGTVEAIIDLQNTLNGLITSGVPSASQGIVDAGPARAAADAGLQAVIDQLGGLIATSNSGFSIIGTLYQLGAAAVAAILPSSRADPGLTLDLTAPAKPSTSDVTTTQQQIADKKGSLIEANQQLAEARADLLEQQKRLMSEQANFSLANLQDSLTIKVTALNNSRPTNDGSAAALVGALTGLQTTLNGIVTTEVPPATEGVSTSGSAKDAANTALQTAINQFDALIAINNKALSDIFRSQQLKAASIDAVPPSPISDPGLALDVSSPAKPSTATAIAINNQTTQITISLSDANQGLAEVKARLIEKQILLRSQQANFDLTSLQELLVATIEAIEASRPTKDGSVDGTIAAIIDLQNTLNGLITSAVPSASQGILDAETVRAAADAALQAVIGQLGGLIGTSNSGFSIIGTLYKLGAAAVAAILPSSRADPGLTLDVSSPAKPSTSDVITTKQEIADKTGSLIETNQQLAEARADLLEQQKLLMSEKANFSLANLRDSLTAAIRTITDSRPTNDGSVAALVGALTGLQTTLNGLKTTDVPSADQGVTDSSNTMSSANAALQAAIGQFNALIATNNKSLSDIFNSYKLESAAVAAVPPSPMSDPGLPLYMPSPATPSTAAIKGIKAQTTQTAISLLNTTQSLADVKARLLEMQISLKTQKTNSDLARLQALLESTVGIIDNSRPTKDGSVAGLVGTIEGLQATLDGLITSGVPSADQEVTVSDAALQAADTALQAVIGQIGGLIATNNKALSDLATSQKFEGALVAATTINYTPDPALALDLTAPLTPPLTNVLATKGQITTNTLTLINTTQSLVETKARLTEQIASLRGDQSSSSLANLRDSLTAAIRTITDSRPTNDGSVAALVGTLTGLQTTLNGIKTTEVPPATQGVSATDSTMAAANTALQTATSQFDALIATNNKALSDILRSKELESAAVAAVPPSLMSDPALPLDVSSPAKPPTAAAKGMNAQTAQATISLLNTTQSLADVKARLIELRVSLKTQRTNSDLARLQGLLVATVGMIENSRPTKDGSVAGLVGTIGELQTALNEIKTTDVPSADQGVTVSDAALQAADTALQALIDQIGGILSTNNKGLFDLEAYHQLEVAVVAVAPRIVNEDPGSILDVSSPEKPSTAAASATNAQTTQTSISLIKTSQDLIEVKAQLIEQIASLRGSQSSSNLAKLKDSLALAITAITNSRPSNDGSLRGLIATIEGLQNTVNGLITSDVPSADQGATTANGIMTNADGALQSVVNRIGGLIAENNAAFSTMLGSQQLEAAVVNAAPARSDPDPADSLDLTSPDPVSAYKLYELGRQQLEALVEVNDGKAALDGTNASIATARAQLIKLQANALIAYQADNVMAIVNETSAMRPDIATQLQNLNAASNNLATILGITLPADIQSQSSTEQTMNTALGLLKSTQDSVAGLLSTDGAIIQSIAAYYNLVNEAFTSIAANGISQLITSNNGFAETAMGTIAFGSVSFVTADPAITQAAAKDTVSRIAGIQSNTENTQVQMDASIDESAADLMRISAIVEAHEILLDTVKEAVNDRVRDLGNAATALAIADAALRQALLDMTNTGISQTRSSDQILLLARIIDGITRAKSLRTELDAAAARYSTDMAAAANAQETLVDTLADAEAAKQAALAAKASIESLIARTGTTQAELDGVIGAGVEDGVNNYIEILKEALGNMAFKEAKDLRELIVRYVNMMEANGNLQGAQRFLEMATLTSTLAGNRLENLQTSRSLLDSYRSGVATRDISVSILEGYVQSFLADLSMAVSKQIEIESGDSATDTDLDMDGLQETLQRIADLKAATDSKNTDIASNETRIDQINKEISSLMAKHGRELAQLNALEHSTLIEMLRGLSMANLNRVNLHSQIQSLMDLLAILNRDVEGNKDAIAELNGIMLQLRSRMDVLLNQIGVIQENIIHLLTDLTDDSNLDDLLKDLLEDPDDANNNRRLPGAPMAIPGMIANGLKGLAAILAAGLGAFAYNRMNPMDNLLGSDYGAGYKYGCEQVANNTGQIKSDASQKGTAAANAALESSGQNALQGQMGQEDVVAEEEVMPAIEAEPAAEPVEAEPVAEPVAGPAAGPAAPPVQQIGGEVDSDKQQQELLDNQPVGVGAITDKLPIEGAETTEEVPTAAAAATTKEVPRAAEPTAAEPTAAEPTEEAAPTAEAPTAAEPTTEEMPTDGAPTVTQKTYIPPEPGSLDPPPGQANQYGVALPGKSGSWMNGFNAGLATFIKIWGPAALAAYNAVFDGRGINPSNSPDGSILVSLIMGDAYGCLDPYYIEKVEPPATENESAYVFTSVMHYYFYLAFKERGDNEGAEKVSKAILPTEINTLGERADEGLDEDTKKRMMKTALSTKLTFDTVKDILRSSRDANFVYVSSDPFWGNGDKRATPQTVTEAALMVAAPPAEGQTEKAQTEQTAKAAQVKVGGGNTNTIGTLLNELRDELKGAASKGPDAQQEGKVEMAAAENSAKSGGYMYY